MQIGVTEIKPTLKASTFASRTSPSKDQSLQKSLFFPRHKKLFLKNFPTLQKNKKRHAHSATDRQENTRTMTTKTQLYCDIQTRWTRTPAANSVLPQLAVTCIIEAECYYQTFVLGDSEVLQNRQLRQHAKR